MSRPVVATAHPAPRPRPGGGATPAGRSPVEALSERLQALTPDHPQLYAVTALTATDARDPKWVPVSGALDAMIAPAGAHLSFSPAVAAAKMTGSLGYAVAGRLAVALAVTGRAYDTGPDSLRLRLDDAGLVERIGVLNPELVVTAADPLAGSAPVTVRSDLPAVIRWAADRVWATLGPLIDEVHELTRYGRVPMWNLMADSVLGPATVAPGRAGLDQATGRATGTALLDALVTLGAPIHRRGTLRTTPPPALISVLNPVSLPAALSPVRGSCCLEFRQTRVKCDSCPLAGVAPN